MRWIDGKRESRQRCSALGVGLVLAVMQAGYPVRAESAGGGTRAGAVPAAPISPDAQYQTGVEFQEGKTGGLSDDVDAAHWYLDAAQRGDPKAWGKLGELYLQGGGGLDRDYGQARYWLEKAAAQGDANAQYHLGVIYAEALGVGANWGEARRWLDKARSNGSQAAAAYLDRHRQIADAP